MLREESEPNESNRAHDGPMVAVVEGRRRVPLGASPALGLADAQHDDASGAIAGCYSLSAERLEKDELPPALTKKAWPESAAGPERQECEPAIGPTNGGQRQKWMFGRAAGMVLPASSAKGWRCRSLMWEEPAYSRKSPVW